MPAIVRLLADDPLGLTRDRIDDGEPLRPYLSALAAIDTNPSHLLVVATVDAAVVGTLQLSVLPGMARRGALRARIDDHLGD
ncbi:hypothetical protein [Arthrobacter sp. H20]|uniref:hypothetical protein n=1 Tax=Arthrobacter sp. H20 TaxID=1267981 RepID=UPI0004B0C21D